MFFMASCSRVPITNRRQTNLFPESEMMSMSLKEYNSFLASHQVVPESDANTQMVKRVGAKVSTAITQYLNSHKQGKRIAGYKWEFNLVQSNEVNAWCMPGGKVVVYTGLLPVTKDENGLAVVLGHEIAHAIARHGNERMSQQMAVQAGGAVVGAVIGSKSAVAENVFQNVYGISSTLGILAYSRKHESEADKLGLCFMAMAGYDPQTSIGFWERMASNGGAAPPQILSTHPSDATRIKDLKAWMPTALKYYNKPK